MTLVEALNLLTAIFGLLAAVATVAAIVIKRPAPKWIRSRWVLPSVLVLLSVLALIAGRLARGPVREVSIATPARDVTVTMKTEGDRAFYVFTATGS